MNDRTDTRQLGIWMTGGLVVGSMIGSGIFMLPVSLGPLGANAVLGWVVSIFGALAIAFALASLSRIGDGGIRAYIERTFGPTTAFLVAWALFWSNIAAQAALAIATASAASSLFPALGGASGIVAVGVGSVVVLTLVNLRGVRTSGGLSLLTVAIKILPLLAVVAILGMRQFSGMPFERLASSSLTLPNIATATALTLFALTGFENATAPVDKVRDPARTIPRAILGGAALVGLIYLVSSSGVMLLLPADRIATSPAPYADVIALRWGHSAASLAALAIAISAFGALNSLMFGTAELGYAMGLRGDLPPIIARTGHDNIPYVAHVISGAMTILLILANSSKSTASLFTFVILLSTAGVLVVYALGALAAWKENATWARRSVFVVALLFIIFAVYGAGMEADLWCLVLLAVGIAIRTLFRALSSRSRGETSRAAARS
ncbi:APC family permease [Sphingomonas sp.]|uniref:APC family permease n=1 Tax=Sphingomonas sp. TaxID=28214 RepID=UPI0038A2DF2C